jgi:hypothetical protein
MLSIKFIALVFFCRSKGKRPGEWSKSSTRDRDVSNNFRCRNMLNGKPGVVRRTSATHSGVMPTVVPTLKADEGLW